MADCECEHGPKVEQMSHTLYGNGDPENALLVRVSGIDKRVRRIERIGWAIIAIFGTSMVTQVARWIKVQPEHVVEAVESAPALMNEGTP